MYFLIWRKNCFSRIILRQNIQRFKKCCQDAEIFQKKSWWSFRIIFTQLTLLLEKKNQKHFCLLAIKGLDPRSVLEFWVLEKNLHSRCFGLTNFLTTGFITETFSAIKRVVKNFSTGYWKITVNCSIPNTQYPIHNTKHSILFCLTGYWKHGKLFTQYPMPITKYPWFWPKKKDTIKRR